VSLAFGPSPIYAHNVSCTVAVAVAKACSTTRKGTCFGQFALPYNSVGEPSFPDAPLFKPRGFECYQSPPPYTAGLPPPPNNVRDPKAIICHRDVLRPGPNFVVDQQLVAYVV
jgi:hypothetical protein